MNEFCWYDGKIAPLSSVGLPLTDLAIGRGYALTEALLAIKGKPFLVDRHLRRFRAGARALGLDCPFSDGALVEAMKTVLAANPAQEKAKLKLILTGGESDDGMTLQPGRSHCFMLVDGFAPLPEACYEQGVSVGLLEYQRPLPEVKTSSYLLAVAQKRAHPHFETIYHWKGELREAATSSVGIVKDGVIIVPQEEVLRGVSMEVALELAAQAGIPVVRRNVSMEEVFAADEVFLAASYKRVVPVVLVEGSEIRNGLPGTITKQLMREFIEFEAADH